MRCHTIAEILANKSGNNQAKDITWNGGAVSKTYGPTGGTSYQLEGGRKVMPHLRARTNNTAGETKR